MKIIITRSAEKDMDKISVGDRVRIIGKLEVFAANPKALANQVKRLQGDPLLRLRVGNYRVLFTEDGIVITVIQVGHRKDVYR